MGLGSFVNKLGDGLEHGVDAVKKKTGELIDDGAHLVGDGLQHVGLDDAADWVEDKGDSIADDLGAHVDEQQLGQTDDPKELLHGDAAKIREAATHLAKFAKAFDTGHTGLAHLDPGDWDGQGGEAFRAKFQTQPPRWAKAATACQDAATALDGYADTVDWALGQAKEAVRLWKQGETKRKTAADAYNAGVDQYNADVNAYNDNVDNGTDPGTKPVKPGAFTDPGAKDKQAAKDTLDGARRQRDTAATAAQTAIKTATALAPAKPDFTDRMTHDVTDINKALPIAGEHFVGGVIRSGTDALKFARGLNPTDPYNLTHPAQYLTHLNATAAGLVDMTAHPERLPSMLLGTGWGSDGSEAGGRLFGNILMAIATDGGSAGAKAGANIAKDAAEQTARTAAEDTARVAAEDSVKSSIPKAAKDCVTDPIDIATGDMILTQTDLALPGALPLILERTHLSSYRTGRLFGPSWASTLDQRLELDDQGAVFVAHDGSLLVYPVPQAGVPALPVEGPRWPLEWDGTPGSSLRITNSDTGRTLHFTAAGPSPAGGPMLLPLTEVSDRNGDSYTIAYDTAGLPTGIRHSGYQVAVDTDGARVTALRLAGGDRPATPVTAFGYDAAGRLTDVTDSSGIPYRFGYDTTARVTSWTDRNDSTYRYEYDSRGRCVRTHGPDGFLSSTLAYDDATRTTAFTDSRGHTTTYRHDTAYRLIARTDPLGHTTVQGWDARHRLTSVVDPLGNTTRYTHDDEDRVTAIERPDGTRLALVYNALGRPVSVTEPGGAVWTHTYDERGNRMSTVDPLGTETRYTRNARGHLTGVTDPLGHTRQLVTDAAGLVTAGRDALGHVTRVERDAFGRVTAVTDPLGHTVRSAWSVEGRPLWREGADGLRESWQWDAEGNLLAQTDRAGNTTRHAYTHFDLAATRTDPSGAVHSFAYDSELRLTGVINPQGLRWSYTYDPAGRLSAETDFNGRTLRYEHDAAGRLATRTNGAGQTIGYSRDGLGRILRQTADRDVTTFAYDGAGNVVRAANPDAEVVMERDVVGRLLAETCGGRTMANTYDAAGHRTLRRTPSGATSAWEWSADGRPTRLRSGTHSLDFTYDAAGREVERLLDGGATLTQSWDADSRLVSQETVLAGAGAGGPVQHRTYSYRHDGCPTAVTDLSEGSRVLELDRGGRVVAVRAEGWSESYAYDNAGNLTHAGWSSPDGGDTQGDRAVTGTMIHRAGRTHFSYDSQGRVVRRTVKLLSGGSRSWQYSWSAEDRLTEVTCPQGERWRYRYDPMGRRIAKERIGDGGAVLRTTGFSWDGSRIAEEYSDGGVTTWDWGPNSHRALTQTSRRLPADASQAEIDERFYSVITDLTGRPAELVDSAGRVAWRQRTTLWGEAVPGTDRASCPLLFPGQYHDEETGLHYNLFRYYLAATGSYLSPDPLGLAPAPNNYAYVSNPFVWTDPLGLGCTDPGYDEVRAQALRDAGVPEGQEPWEVREWVPSTGPEWQGSPQLFDAEHRPIYFREEDHLTDAGDLITFQDHWTGHREPGEDGYQRPHVHVRPVEDPRNGQLPGAEEHYYYDPSLGRTGPQPGGPR